MTFLEALQSHKGGLIRLKWGLYWYGGRGWDGVHDRICLLMDSALSPPFVNAATSTAAASAAAEAHADAEAAGILLLIDGRPHWVWVAQEDVELL